MTAPMLRTKNQIDEFFRQGRRLQIGLDKAADNKQSEETEKPANGLTQVVKQDAARRAKRRPDDTALEFLKPP